MTELTESPILPISVAARLLKLHPRTIMLYETLGLIRPFRSDTKRRLYSIEDVNRVQFIRYLTQEKGINLEGVKNLLEAIKIGEENGILLKKRLFPEFKLQKLV